MHLEDGKLTLSPSDVTGFLACEHLTALAVKVAKHELAKPERDNPQADLIFRKGNEHERAYLERLRADGRSVTEIEFDWSDWEKAKADTLAAMRSGVDIVYQAVFTGNGWHGLADFLLKVDAPSDLGAWSYEALDTKLARSSKPAYLLQLLYYSEELAVLQGRAPEQIHVLLGSGEQESFRPQDFAAYYRRVRSRLEEFVAEPASTEPYPVSHCEICSFKPVCESRWDELDHLSRVAGIRRTQIEGLEKQGITTLAALGRTPEDPAPAGDRSGCVAEASRAGRAAALGP